MPLLNELMQFSLCTFHKMADMNHIFPVCEKFQLDYKVYVATNEGFLHWNVIMLVSIMAEDVCCTALSILCTTWEGRLVFSHATEANWRLSLLTFLSRVPMPCLNNARASQVFSSFTSLVPRLDTMFCHLRNVVFRNCSTILKNIYLFS